MDMKADVHGCYVDFKKFSDNVRHEKQVQILKTKHINKKT